MGKKALCRLGFAITAVVLCIIILVNKLRPVTETVVFNDYQTISNNGYIRVGILQNTTDYYIENGNVRGFHYELVESFAAHTQLKVQYISYDSYWDIFFALLNSEVDLLAMDINSNFQRDVFFSYTHPHSYSKHVLVQRKDEFFIDNNLDINKKNSLHKENLLLAIPAFSTFYDDALHLCSDKNTSDIDILVLESLHTNYFLDMLVNKEINFTIEDKKIMDANSLFYNELDYSVSLTDSLPLYWAVNKGNFSLQQELNNWLDSLKRTRAYPILLTKYYSPNSQNRQKLATRQYKMADNSISVYDDLIQKQAERYKLDWRLVAAVIHQESRFKPNLIGKGGSHGLMQLMPKTAEGLKINDRYSIEGQIAAGCKLLRFLSDRYIEKGITDTMDLYKFTLAAYNAGHGRIDDVMSLTEAVGLNPLCWNNVEKILPKMSDRKYIRGAGLNIKSYNGKYTKNYVFRVWIVYRHYCNMVE